MQFLGATIIAGVAFFLLNFFGSLILDRPSPSAIGAFLEAAVKTAIFVTVFHYLHNFVAKLLGWYKLDNPRGKHTFDRNPALDELLNEEEQPSNRGGQ